MISACECTTSNQDDLQIKTYKKGDSDIIKLTFDSTEKTESETVDVDIILTQTDPKRDAPIMEFLQFKFELIE